ncbi:PEP-CTERM sorting domain-containing protein [Eleftheria terrae]|uniref:PEP-CTERM sorting domain-containing protein n=1 Tax=Eleftheria terrae TaxID=1597781 RepID=UPI00263BA9E5|nr:PEP-CTERM sorting domain-containing protein [Eleftheria terrae]WKB52399.1 PEP-CTERM sorting domain-containing protein [Eleftheria terrae]
MLKRFAVASLAALAALGSAEAAPLQLILDRPGAQATDFDPVRSLDGRDYGFGALVAEAGAMVTYTLLGSESDYANVFEAAGAALGGTSLPGHDPRGQSILESVDSTRLLGFSFSTIWPAGYPRVVNGEPGAPFAIFGDGQTPVETEFGSFQYVLGFNDGGTDIDYDDLVIGVNAVPEPATTSLMLAGLLGGGWLLRRRKPR